MTPSRVQIFLCFILLIVKLCKSQEIGRDSNLDIHFGNFITDHAAESSLYRFPPWHFPNNPPPRNLRSSLARSPLQLTLRNRNHPPRDNVAEGSASLGNRVVVEFSDVRDSRSIVGNGRVPDSIGSETTNEHSISINPAQFIEAPFEINSPQEILELSDLSGKSQFTPRDSISSFSEVSPSISSPVFAKLPSESLQPPRSIISNLIKVPKFDPLPLEEHQPLPKEPSKNSAKDKGTNDQFSDHNTNEQEIPEIVFPPTVIFRDQEIASSGRFPVIPEENFDLQLPVTPRGLNSLGFLKGDPNSVFPKSIQEIIKEQRPFRRPFLPPSFNQPRKRFRNRRRGILSWIWPSR